MLRMMSVTSSTTPGMDENSCSTPSIFTLVTRRPAGGQQDAAQRVADGRAEATLERADHELAVGLGGLDVALDPARLDQARQLA